MRLSTALGGCTLTATPVPWCAARAKISHLRGPAGVRTHYGIQFRNPPENVIYGWSAATRVVLLQKADTNHRSGCVDPPGPPVPPGYACIQI